MVQNGVYYQTELRNEEIVIHIYHQSNPLHSKLIQERIAEPGVDFYCIVYGVGKYQRLRFIKAVHLRPNAESEWETLYQVPRIETMAG